MESVAEADTVTKETKFALGAKLGIKQFDGTRSKVTCVFEFRLASLSTLLVEGDQVGIGHVDFAAKLEGLWDVFSAKALRKSSQRSNIVCDIITDLAIASRHRLDQQSVVVAN